MKKYLIKYKNVCAFFCAFLIVFSLSCKVAYAIDLPDPTGILNSLGNLGNSIGGNFTNLGNSIGGGFTNMVNGIQGVGNSINGLVGDISTGFANLGNSIANIPTTIENLPGKIGDAVGNSVGTAFTNAINNTILNPIGRVVESDLTTKINAVDADMQAFQMLLSQEDLSGSQFGFAQTLWSSMKPIGYSLVSLFFIISFCKKTIYFEMMNDLEVYKQLVKLIFAKSAVDYSYTILTAIVSVNRGIVNTIFGVLKMADKSQMIQYINSNSSTDVIQLIGNCLKSTVLMTSLGICLIICMVIVVIRQIELAVLAVVSPMFFATLAGDSTSDIFKSFIKNFVAVTVQTIWIAVGLAFLKNSYLTSITVGSDGLLSGSGIFGFTNFIVGIVALTVYCVQAPASVRNSLGGSGGGGFNISSLAIVASFV
ncbi:hypothetical protein [Clostridium akagii]|uniref:hypothetical protein n=1 Tax=Clostridium akagii TaxID=91623 RepID=UPI00047AD5AA|nr:hypothetical protein [Clostridium akagii]